MKLDYTSNLPSWSDSKRLNALGHPGYSDGFAHIVLTHYAHNGNVFQSIRIAHEIISR